MSLKPICKTIHRLNVCMPLVIADTDGHDRYNCHDLTCLMCLKGKHLIVRVDIEVLGDATLLCSSEDMCTILNSYVMSSHKHWIGVDYQLDDHDLIPDGWALDKSQVWTLSSLRAVNASFPITCKIDNPLSFLN